MPKIPMYADKYAMSDLSAHIQGRMKADGLTQMDLGKKLKKSQQTISRLLNEPEKMSICTLRSICNILEIDHTTVMNAVWCEKNKGGVYYETYERNSTKRRGKF